MSTSLYTRLLSLLPDQPQLTATVSIAHADGTATVAFPGAGVMRVRNPLKLPQGAQVYVQGDAITGDAPDLPYVLIEV